MTAFAISCGRSLLPSEPGSGFTPPASRLNSCIEGVCTIPGLAALPLTSFEISSLSCRPRQSDNCVLGCGVRRSVSDAYSRRNISAIDD